MARETQRQKLGKLHRRLGMAKKYRQAEGFDATWRRMLDLYEGKHFEASTDEDRIAVNIAFSTLNVIYPAISVAHPKTTVTAVREQDWAKAVICEVVVDDWWRHTQVKPQFRLAVKDFLIFGHGWLKVGYRYREGERDRSAGEFAGEAVELLQQLTDSASAVPELAGELPSPEDVVQLVPDRERTVKEDGPFVERVSPFDMFVDPEATNMGNIKWLAQRMVRPIDEVRTDERYEPSVRRKVAPSQSVNEAWLDGGRRKKYGTDIDRAVVWEFYDVTHNTVSVFAEGCRDGFLVKPRPMPYSFGHPFVMVRNYDVPDRFYPMGDLEQLEPIQQELNKTRSQLMNTRKQFKRKYLYSRDAFDNAAIQALESDRDGAMVGVDTNQVPLDQIVRPMPVNSIPPELFSYSQIITSDLDRVSGVSEYQLGMAPQVRRTATEASMIQDAVQARSTEKLNVVERAVGEVSERMVRLARQFLTGEQVASFAGAGGERIWVPFKQSNLDADFMFDVEGGSTAAHDENWKKQQAMELLNTLMPLAQSGVVNVPAVLTYALRQFGVKDPSRFVMEQQPQPPQPPEGQAQAPPGGPQVQQPPQAPQGPQGPPQQVAMPPQVLQTLLGGGGGAAAPQVSPDMLVRMLAQQQAA